MYYFREKAIGRVISIATFFPLLSAGSQLGIAWAISNPAFENNSWSDFTTLKSESSPVSLRLNLINALPSIKSDFKASG